MKLILTTEDELKALIKEAVSEAMKGRLSNSPSNNWLTLKDLRAYLPNKPSAQTIYKKVSAREIPHKKEGNRLLFLQSEIDAWLQAKGRQTTAEVLNSVKLKKK